MDGRIAVHDSNHVELKLDYIVPLHAGTRYRVESYFFVPTSLGVNEHSYSATQFYSDVQGYIRFKTPALSMAELGSRKGPDAPLSVIDTLLAQLTSTPSDTRALAELSRELKMFGCVSKAILRDRGLVLRQHPFVADGEVADAALRAEFTRLLTAFVRDVQEHLAHWRRIDVSSPRLPQAVRETFSFVDEYLSLLFELRLSELLHTLQTDNGLQADSGSQADSGLHANADGHQNVALHNSDGVPAGAAWSLARDAVLRERQHRKVSGYVEVFSLLNGAEYLPFRLGMLKKFVHSVLWLEINKEREGVTAAQVIAGVAAGSAMFFAVVATIYQSRWFALNSWSFVIAATLTYILKDRLKDWLKLVLGRSLERWFYDYGVDICDPITGTRIGRCREGFAYVSGKRIPAEVSRVRMSDAVTSIEAEAKPEVVLRYTKDIQLTGDGLEQRLHLEQYDVNDIIRISFRCFLNGADDSRASVSVYDVDTDRVALRLLRKVYHVNMVFAFFAEGEAPAYRRIRVVLDRQGILRLEEPSAEGVLSEDVSSVPSSGATAHPLSGKVDKSAYLG